jgi:hypothetical protein
MIFDRYFLAETPMNELLNSWIIDFLVNFLILIRVQNRLIELAKDWSSSKKIPAQN